MTESHRQLIGDLVSDLTPVARPGRIGRPTGFWLAVATVYSVVIILGTGSIRPGAFADLASHLSFIAETALAVLAVAALAVAAMSSAIPDETRPVRWLLWLLPVALWVSVYVVELRYPPEYVSSLGDRGPCEWEVVLFSLPALGLLLWRAGRFFPLRPRFTGLLAGAAAAAIPAELMQFGCVYVPTHILAYHIAPIALTAALGALIGPWALTRKSAIRPRRTSPLH
ncbi:MAG: NrsF family protein [Gammaproteobacteria bacterium]